MPPPAGACARTTVARCRRRIWRRRWRGRSSGRRLGFWPGDRRARRSRRSRSRAAIASAASGASPAAAITRPGWARMCRIAGHRRTQVRTHAVPEIQRDDARHLARGRAARHRQRRIRGGGSVRAGESLDDRATTRRSGARTGRCIVSPATNSIPAGSAASAWGSRAPRWMRSWTCRRPRPRAARRKPMRENNVVQSQVAQCEARWRSARAFLHDAWEQAWAHVEATGEQTARGSRDDPAGVHLGDPVSRARW